MMAESINPFEIQEYEDTFSNTGFTIYFKRNALGLMVSSFYIPTTIFSMLSMLSYSIKIDSVSNLFKGTSINNVDSYWGKG